MFTRRGLLVAAGTATAAALAGCTVDPDPSLSRVPADLDPSDWRSVREQFRLDEATANFATFYLASHAKGVRDAIETHRAGLDADPHGYLDRHWSELDGAVFGAAATFLDTFAGQVAITDSTTMGLGLIYTGIRLEAGDDVLTTEHDFFATHESLRMRTEREPVQVRRVRLYDEPGQARADEIVDRLAAAVRAKTRVVAITWVHSSTGVMLPVRAIADALAEVNRDRPAEQRALLCVDGVHGFAADAATPGDLGCDFLISGCHKWLFGPRGTGFVWGHHDAWPRFTPVIPSFVGGPDGPAGRWATPGGFQSFEHRWALTEAFALHRAIGAPRVAARTRELATALKDGLAELPKVRLHTPRAAELSAGLVCCEVDGYTAEESVARLLEAKVQASATPYTPSYLRFGPSILNDESDVQRALAAVRAL